MKLRQQEIPMPINIMAGILLPMRMRIIRIFCRNGKTATHYISDAEYKLTPGTGNYDFVPDDTAPEQTVEVDHMYYQGGYTNHDWFKQYVFHLEPGEEGSDERKQFDAFKIEVTTNNGR